MALTQTDLDNAVAAWVGGVLTLEVDDGNGGRKRVTYQSRKDLEQVIGVAAAALGVANPIAPASNASTVSFAQFSPD